MSTFLSQSASRILKDHPKDLQNVLVLLPNKRGELFLKRALSASLEHPVLAPAMFTIEEFVQAASGFQKQSQQQLLIHLFKVYVEKVDTAETFDNFIKWGNMLLHDFNEIDRHLVDAKQLFNNLLDAKTIESWGVELGSETELMKNFLGFWKNLEPLYREFNKALEAENLSYQGKAFRAVAENKSRIDDWLGGNYSGIYLLGFNALNKAEEKIFQYLAEQKSAILLWDTDEFYLNDPIHEAGDFLRKYKNNWKVFNKLPFEWQQKYWAETPKKIQAISAPSQLGMAAAAGQILDSLPLEEQVSTAVVLADESMLLPMLDAIPAAYKTINVTMGLSLKHAPLAHDVLAILKMHEQAERTAASGSGYAFHHKTFLAVIESALFISVANEASQKIIQALTAANSVFISPKSAVNLLNSFGLEKESWYKIFKPVESSTLLIEQIDEVLLQHAEEIDPDNALAKQAAFTLHQAHRQLLDLLGLIEVPLENKTLLRFYQSILAEQQIDFYGEPLAGLQVMGMLETRTLDFKRIIITSINEGILPAGKAQNSFIPYDLKGHFELPTHQEKDAVYAYHFYRLLQRAEEVWLIYDSDMSGIGSKEKSRFILQLENETSDFSNIKMLPTIHFSPEVHKESLLKVPNYKKDDDVLARLWQMATKGFSPSSLVVYLNDPAQFYVERLLRVDDPDEIKETIGHDVLGTVVHDALEEIYTPFVKRVLSAEMLKSVKNVEDIVLEKLSLHYKGNTKKGRNLLIKNVAIHMTKQVLKQDILRIQQLNTEGKLLTTEVLEDELLYECTIEGLEKPIVFKGVADRIDREGNTVYILDYKTGFLKPEELSCQKGVDLLFEAEKKNKAFQVMFYAWLFYKKYDMPSGGLQAGLFSTRSPSVGFDRLKLNKQNQIEEADLIAFEEKLFGVIIELFEATHSFSPRSISVRDED